MGTVSVIDTVTGHAIALEQPYSRRRRLWDDEYAHLYAPCAFSPSESAR
jgi:hypothetical protein